MLKKIISALIILIIVSPGFSQKKTLLDVKTPLLEKSSLMAAKAGTIYFITQSADLGVREAGEDYALWMKNYKSRQNGKKITIEYTIELRSPAMFRKGRLIASESLKVTYRLDEKREGGLFKSFDHFKKNVKRMKDELMLEGFYCGQETVRIARELIEDAK